MAVDLYSVPITYRLVRMPPSDAGDQVIAQTAAIAFARVREGWPVDTGVSRGGLYYSLTRTSRGAVMTIGDRNDYARWVERLWYPLDRVITPARLRRWAASARRNAGREQVPSELTNVVDPSKSHSRPVTVRPISGGTARRRPTVPLRQGARLVSWARRRQRAGRPPGNRQLAARVVAAEGLDSLPADLLDSLTEEAIRRYARTNGLSEQLLLLLLTLLRSSARQGTGNVRGATAVSRRRRS